jgi:hypothetical protein
MDVLAQQEAERLKSQVARLSETATEMHATSTRLKGLKGPDFTARTQNIYSLVEALFNDVNAVETDKHRGLSADAPKAQMPQSKHACHDVLCMINGPHDCHDLCFLP